MDSKFLKYIAVLLVIIAIGFGGVKGFQANKEARKANQEAVISFADMTKEISSKYSLQSDSNIQNILLVGADKRGSESGYGRSDCMRIASIDAKNNALKLTSLMGDTYVEIPGYGENRLSMAYSMGGISLLYETIAYNYGVALDNYAILEFPDFVQVIDQIGGVSIEISETEAKYMQQHYTNAAREVKLGTNVLNGTQALAYVRIKQDALGDYGRNARQRKVMKAIYKELTKTSVAELVPIVSDLLKNTSTDMTAETMKAYFASVLKLANTDIKEKTIPLDDTYTTQNVEGAVAYKVEKEQLMQAAQDFIFNPVTKEEAEKEE